MKINRDLESLATSIAGLRIPGGCDDCDAYQTFQKVGGVYLLTVHHDETCPTYRRHRRGRR